jgi:cytochrome b
MPPALRVWDPLVRLFHWSLAAGFTVAYVTEDDFLTLHVWAGYSILALIGFRVIWGFVGSQRARWSDFVKPPSQIRAYVADALHFRAARYIGHNPAGGAMVLALLLSLGAAGISGLLLYGAAEHSGPMAQLTSDASASGAETLEEVHEWFANLSLFLVIFHLLGVAFSSFQHGENLVKAMITGDKRA